MWYTSFKNSKIAPLRGFLFGPPVLPEITLLANPIVNLFVRELKNTGTKKLNKDIFVDAERKIISQKFKKGIPSITGSRINLKTMN